MKYVWLGAELEHLLQGEEQDFWMVANENNNYKYKGSNIQTVVFI